MLARLSSAWPEPSRCTSAASWRASRSRIGSPAPSGAPVVAVLGGISAGRNVFKVAATACRLVGRNRRSRQGAGHGPLPGPRHRLPGRQSPHDRARVRRGVPERQRARPGRPDRPVASWTISASTEPARLRRRVVRRHGHAGDGRKARGAAAARHRDQRRPPHASDVDGLAQRPAQFRALRHRARRRRAGTRAGAGAGHDDIPVGARVRGALLRRAVRTPGRAIRVSGRGVHRARAGEGYAAHYRPEAFVCLSESIDLHRIEPGDDRRADDAGRGRWRTSSCRSPTCARCATGSAAHCQLVEISSMYGHDAFLKEIGRAARRVRRRHSNRPCTRRTDPMSHKTASRPAPCAPRSRPTPSTAPSCRRFT